MWEKIKKHFQLIRNFRPGERFQRYYYEKREQHPVKSIIKIVISILCLGIAVILTFTPGPAFVFWILGFALLSAQLITVARFLDRAEVWARKFLKK
ncbi:MAG TPA: hypothetical protein VI749_07880 [Candidatus Omnitrophota bacterium]|nr:hypothetical protein [Candidatus Omnitrophota bacterium]